MIKQGWEFIKATEYCQSVIDGTHDSPKMVEKGKPLITSKHIKGRKIDFENAYFISEDDYNKINKRSKVDQWDVIISMIGEYCGYCYVERDQEINYAIKNVGVFKTGDKLDAEWLYYYLNSNVGKAYLTSARSGSSQPYIPLGALRSLSILIPPRGEDKKNIVKILSILDAKIDLNNRINAELGALAKTLYDYWFVQFDFPDENGRPYKSSGGAMQYSVDLKREIPVGWEVKPIADFIAKDKSGDWGKESFEGNYTQKVICIRGTDLNGLNGKGEVKAPVRFILEKNLHKLLEPNDLIVEISGGSPTQSTGRLAAVTTEAFDRFDSPLICSNFCRTISLKDAEQLFYFVYTWNRLYDNRVLFGWEGKTSGIKNLLFDSFAKAQKIVLPSKEMNKKFYDIVKPLHIKMQSNLLENHHLAALRDWLLPMLMNGQVRVK
jgi:type I restriction enzyme, S subunit